MTAATVPPPSWIPIGAPEIRANARRFFTRALAISAAGHLVVLAIVLWLRSTAVDTEPRWILTPARFTPPPEILRPIPPRAPTSEPTPAKRTIDGSIDPTDVIVPDPPDATAGVKPAETGSKTNGTSSAPPSPNAGDFPIENTPGEGAFVAFDQPPVPYYRPAPDYPGWARDQGIQGRVVLHVLVGRDGRVTRITVLRGIAGLTGAAREAIAQWRFHPALSGRNPVAVWVEIPIEFRL